MYKQLLIIFSFISFFSKAQNVIEINNDFQKKGILKLENQTQFYLDSSQKKTIKDIRKVQFYELKNKDKISKFFNTTWLKISVKNISENDTIKALFYAGNHFETTLYLFDNQEFAEIKSSVFSLENQRLFRFDGQYLPIVLLPNKNYTFYASINNFSLKKIQLSPSIISYEWKAKKKETDLYNDRFAIATNYSLIAILLFLAIFTLLQYFLSLQRYFLYYSFYLFSMMTFAIWGFIHSPYIVHFLSYFPFLAISLRQNFYIILTHFCYFLFIREFLEIKISHPKTDKIIRFLMQSLLVMLGIEIFLTLILKRFDLEAYFTVFTQIYLSVFGIIILFLIYKIHTKLAIYIKIGSTFLLFAGLFGFISSWLNWFPTSSDVLEYYPNALFNFFVLLEIFFFSMGLGYKTFEIISQKNDLEQAVSLSELNTLRLQINPHFLFNSLNSIKSYIIKNKTDEAADYLTDFSILIRSILQNSKEQVVSLKEEVETLLLYTKFERFRFQNKFEFVYEIDENIDIENVQIPALLLQPYIENAIKHGLASKEKNGALKLIIKDLDQEIEIIIDDNGIGRKRAAELKNSNEGHQSMGMKINEERIKLLNKINDWHISVEIIDKFTSENISDGTKVIMKIPK